MEKVLVICGPTATGKTDLALSLAGKYKGELMSADSRQVYKGLDIGTGKDVPENFELRNSKRIVNNLELNYYTNFQTRIWGYDIISADEDFSISQFSKVARATINNILERKKLPIIVGGSGLYIKALTSIIETADIPRDDTLRNFLDKKNAEELFEILAQNDPLKAGKLNMSDKKNKRRLTRAIEVSKWQVENKKRKPNMKKDDPYDYLYIGLKLSKQKAIKRISNRVKKRINSGFQEEVERLLMSGVSWGDQSMQSLGYKQIRDYFLGKINKEEFIDLWIAKEVNYYKRQVTWFKKVKDIIWFDSETKDLYYQVEEVFRKWYY